MPVCLAQVFCYTGEQAHEEMRSACFDYLRLGGMYSAGAPGDTTCSAALHASAHMQCLRVGSSGTLPAATRPPDLPAGPVSLLSGLNPRPSVLVAHFFMVAVYGIGRLLLPRPTLRGLWTGLLLLWGAAGACSVTYIEAALWNPLPSPLLRCSDAGQHLSSCSTRSLPGLTAATYKAGL